MQKQSATTVRRLEVSESSVYRDLRLRALAESPDAFGSTLSAEQTRTTEEWASRLKAGCSSGLDLPLIAEVGEAAAGLAWGKADAANRSVVNLYQMWVAPEFRGQGLGHMLLREVVEWSRSLGAESVFLGVTCGDTPATRLYIGEGFIPVGEPERLRLDSELLAQCMRLHLAPVAA